MGSVLSRWKKKETTTEILEGIDKEISRIEKFRRSTQELRSKVIGNLILYSIVIYVIACITLYFLFVPSTALQQCLQILPFFCFPVLIYVLKRLLHWWFVRRISKNELQMQELKEQRKEILENVMETETYKKAKEILEKFDPETKKKLEEERRHLESPARTTSPDTELRRRNTVATSPQGGSPRLPLQSPPFRTPAPGGLVGGRNPMMTPGPTAQGPRPPMTPALPRPLLRQDRSSLEKLVEYFVGDGPGNRYALICCNCYSHNGMALREEFEFMEYRCAYCRYFNPARKQRPTAPRLPARVNSPMVKRNGMPRLSETKDDIVCRIASPVAEDENSEGHNSEVFEEKANASGSSGGELAGLNAENLCEEQASENTDGYSSIGTPETLEEEDVAELNDETGVKEEADL